jgi:hypothetical protein
VIVRALDAHDIMRLWETCASLHPIDRVLAILHAGAADVPEPFAALPIGERERRAAALRVQTFGGAAEGANACPACELVHEIDPPLAAILAAPAIDATPVAITVGDYRVVARPPDSYDQAALTGCADPGDALRTLLARCVIEARRDGEPLAIDAVPEPVIAEIAQALAEHDGNAESLIRLACARCGHEWTMIFDAGEFLWAEVEQHARRLRYEVHTLARAYHWAERDILAMSAQRREAYLDLVGA